MVKTIAAGVKLHAVIFEVALVLREIQVSDEMGCPEDSLTVLVNVDPLIRRDGDGPLPPRLGGIP